MLARAIRMRTSRSGSSAAARSPWRRSSRSRRASSGSSRFMWTHDCQYCARIRSPGRPPLASSWVASASAGPARTTSRIRAYGLSGAEQELTPDDAIGGLVGEVGVRLGGLCVTAGREVQVRVDARPAARVIGEQRVGRRAQSGREVVQGRHRGLRMAQLERADVRLGVAVARQLLLGQVGREPRRTDPGADGLGELALVDDDPTPGLDLGVGHRRIIRRVKSWSTADPRFAGTRRAGRRAGRSSAAGRGATGSSDRARPRRRTPS